MLRNFATIKAHLETKHRRTSMFMEHGMQRIGSHYWDKVSKSIKPNEEEIHRALYEQGAIAYLDAKEQQQQQAIALSSATAKAQPTTASSINIDTTVKQQTSVSHTNAKKQRSIALSSATAKAQPTTTVKEQTPVSSAVTAVLQQGNKINFVGEDFYLQLRPYLAREGILEPEICDLVKREVEQREREKERENKKNGKKVSSQKAKTKTTKTTKTTAFIKTMVVEQTAKGRKNKNALNNRDLFRLNNIINNINHEVATLIASLSNENIMMLDAINCNSPYYEITLLKLMLMCRRISSQLSKFDDEEKTVARHQFLEQANELIIGAMYAKEIVTDINASKDKKDLSRIEYRLSNTCIEDFEAWIQKLKFMVKFNMEQMVEKYPVHLFKNRYFSIFKKSGNYTLNRVQQNILNFVIENEKFLGLVTTIMGSGKTSLVLPLSNYFLKKRSEKNDCNDQIIYCCPNQSVLLEVGRILYKRGIAFAFAMYCKTPETKSRVNPDAYPNLKFSFSNFADVEYVTYEDPRGGGRTIREVNLVKARKSTLVYLCDMYGAYHLLQENKEIRQRNDEYIKECRDGIQVFRSINLKDAPNYLFIGDEPTIDADSQVGYGDVESGFSNGTEIFVECMKMIPSQILLMSATLPRYQELKDFYDRILSLHSDMKLGLFQTSETKIGCAIIQSDGRLYAPHSGCNTISHVKSVINAVSVNPFIGRLYNYSVLSRMHTAFLAAKLPVEDINKRFSKITDLTQTNIQKAAYDMLNVLIESNSDEKVIKACSMEIAYEKLDITQIFTRQISEFNQSCLIFSANPIETAIAVYRANFEHIFTTNDNETIFDWIDYPKIMSTYQKEYDIWKSKVDNLRDKLRDKSGDNQKDYSEQAFVPKESTLKSTSRLTGSVTTSNNQRKKKTPLVGSQTPESMLRDLIDLENKPPKWNFPEILKLCSPAHLAAVGCKNRAGIAGIITPDDIPKDTSDPIPILTMLCSGIGVYSMSNLLSNEYRNTVMHLATVGKIKFLFGGDELAFGHNWEVSNILYPDKNKTLYKKPRINQNLDDNNIIKEVEPQIIDTIISLKDKSSIKKIMQMFGRAGRDGHSYEARVHITSDDHALIDMINSYIQGTLDEGDRDEVRNILRAYYTLWP